MDRHVGGTDRRQPSAATERKSSAAPSVRLIAETADKDPTITSQHLGAPAMAQ